MKKRIVTYIFCLCVIQLSTVFLSRASQPVAPAKAVSISCQSLNPAPQNNEEERKQPDRFFRLNCNAGVACSVVTSFAEQEPGTAVCAAQRLVTSRAELSTGKIIPDFLLHLFPSHYFW